VTGAKLNLCLACRDVEPDSAGGLARATRELAVALAADGHEVHLLTNRPSTTVAELPGVFVTPLRAAPATGRFAMAGRDTAAQNLMHAAAVYREVRHIHEHTRPVDAVLTPLWRSEGAVCALDDRFPTIVSCMTSIQTLTEVDPNCGLIPDIGERVALEREALRRCRYLHGLTQAALTKTISDHALTPEATAVISRGLRDRRPAAPAPKRVKAAPQVLFVGRLEHRKGVDTLLTAARSLIADGVDVEFTLAGPSADPHLREAFAVETALHPGLRDRVHFTGEVSDADLVGLYEGADIVCSPSRYESHGIVLLEAMMFGKPIVTCAVGGIGEVITPDHDGLFVAPDDARALAHGLRRLLADPPLQARLGLAARRTYEERFEAQRVARQTHAFMIEVRALQIRQLRAPEAETVSERLAGLIAEVLGLDAGAASRASAELLDPYSSPATRSLRAAAAEARPRRPSGPSLTRRVTAVLLTHNRAELLGRALDSLEQSGPSPKVIVIDNASASGPARRVAEDCARRPQVTLHRSEEDLGCAGGRRLGVRLADTEFVLFLDDDAELLPGALEHLVAELDAHPSAGAVAPTVVGVDGRVLHSGGDLENTGELAVFLPRDAGTAVDAPTLEESGETGWVQGTAALVRRDLLTEFEIDAEMAAYFEDAEWSYRVSLARPGIFRRSREALAVHNFEARPYGGATLRARSATVRMLAACARFHELHGVLLAPALFEIMPELSGDDGMWDRAAARLLMELVTARGPDWVLAAWMAGDLDVLLDERGGHPRRTRIESELRELTDQIACAQAELAQARHTLLAQEATLEILHQHHETLRRIEQGGWWQLRGRILPLLRLADRVAHPSRTREPTALAVRVPATSEELKPPG
jgi:glycosyltransferase involved in cell wall biosynthesis